MIQKKENIQKYYILMADIIGSRNKKGNILMDQFSNVVKQVTKESNEAFFSPITITLGDEFQSVVKSLKDGIKIITSIEEYIIKYKYEFKLRYILYYGTIETSINSEIAYEMLGEGLTKAREYLGNHKKEENRIHFELQNEKSVILNKLFYLYTSLLDKWKIKDFELIYSFIRNADYKEVARKLNKDRANVWRKNKSLQIHQYITIKELIDKIVIL